tara:strand:+ start:742 stop:1263 length:522 start_codon:yes stop_codon:yes gene_type:complete
MRKNNLLNESTIRKFMKLASIEPLASDFLGRIQEVEDKEELEESTLEDEVDLEEGGDMMYKDDDMDVDMDMDVDADMDADMDMDADLGGEVGGKMVDVDAFISALESALESAMGEPAEVEYEDVPAELDAEEPADELDMGAGLGDEDEEEEEEEEDLAETIYKEVLKRMSEKK